MEPSCGDGNFLAEGLRRFLDLGVPEEEIKRHLHGVELDKKEAKKAARHHAKIVRGDFFAHYRKKIHVGKPYDVVLGNPPFIRYQNFDESYRSEAFALMNEFGFQPNRLTNSWVPFLVLSSMALTENGRLGMVIPAELFQVDYAAEVRLFLSEYFEQLTIITFRKLVFDDIQQEVVLLLGERSSDQPGIRAVELNDLDELRDMESEAIWNAEVKTLDHSSDKWTKYFLTRGEIDLLRELDSDERLVPTTRLFEVNVGLVSGENKFFVVNQAAVERWGLESSVEPIVSRTEQLKGIVLTGLDFDGLKAVGKKVCLFSPGDRPPEELSDRDRAYIAYGESQKYHKNYKCGIRKRWYVVPQSWRPEAFILRQVNRYPKIVLNRIDAQVTDTIHKIRFLDEIAPETVAAAFLNSYTLALSETVGRSYGGGVLTFEPGEIRRLKIPMEHAERLNLDRIDALIRRGDIETALEENDEILLRQGLGWSEEQVLELRQIWFKLSNRRVERKKSKKAAAAFPPSPS